MEKAHGSIVRKPSGEGTTKSAAETAESYFRSDGEMNGLRESRYKFAHFRFLT